MSAMIFNSSRTLHKLFLLPGPTLQGIRLMVELPRAFSAKSISCYCLSSLGWLLAHNDVLSLGTDPIDRGENLSQAGPIRFLPLGLRIFS